MGRYGLWTAGRARWRTLGSLALLTAVATAFVLGALQDAERSTTSYQRLLDRSAAPDVLAFVPSGSTEDLVGALRAEPEVAAVGAFSWLPLTPEGMGQATGLFSAIGDGFGTEVLRSVILAGRPADPARADEVTVNEALATATGVGVGDELHLTAAVEGSTGPSGQVVRVVGVHLNALDVGPNASAPSVLGTPALGARWWPVFAELPGFESIRAAVGIRLHPGADLDRLIERFTSDHPEVGFATDVLEGDITAGLGVEATALRILAATASLAAAAVVVLAMIRSVRSLDLDTDVLAALGATRAQRTRLAAAPTGVAVTAGALAAPVLAVATSGLTRTQLVRLADPDRGAWLDPLGLALATAAAVVLLLCLVGAVTWHGSRTVHRAPVRRTRTGLAGWAAWSPALAVGLRSATGGLDRDARRTGRAAVIGGCLGAAGAVAVLTWLASDRHLEHDLRLQGWEFDAAAEFAPGAGPSAASDATATLRASEQVIGLGRYERIQVPIGGSDVDTFAFEAIDDRIEPVIVRGRMPRTDGEAVAGRPTLERLGADIGDRIVIDGTGPDAGTLTLVGEAIFPFLGNGTWGDTVAVTPATLHRITPGILAEGLLIRLEPGAAPGTVADLLGPDVQVVLPSAAPTVTNVVRAGAIVRILVVFFAVLGTAAFAFSVLGAGQRRLREIGVLRAIGMRRPQIRVAAAVQVAVLGTSALGVGILAGSVLGRLAWRSTQQHLGVLDATAVPWPGLALTVSAGLALCTACGVELGRRPLRRSAGDALRVGRRE